MISDPSGESASDVEAFVGTMACESGRSIVKRTRGAGVAASRRHVHAAVARATMATVETPMNNQGATPRTVAPVLWIPAVAVVKDGFANASPNAFAFSNRSAGSF